MERERGRRAAVAVTITLGAVLIFKMTALLEPVFSMPETVLYGLTGALFGAIAGAVQRADEFEDRVLHALVGAMVAGLAFALFSLGDPHPRTFWWS